MLTHLQTSQFQGYSGNPLNSVKAAKSFFAKATMKKGAGKPGPSDRLPQ